MRLFNIAFVSVFKKLIFFFVIILVLGSCQKDDIPITPLIEGAAPIFSLSSLDGGKVTLSDFNNKVVVLFFFGSGCPSCKAIAPDIENMLITPFASRTDYQVLGLDQWNGNQTSVEAFKSSTGVSFPLLLNASGVAADYKTTYDRLVVIDKNGDIVFSGTQLASLDIAAVKQKVELVLGSQSGVMGTAPKFSLTSITGTEVNLVDFNNKVVVLFFFGYNCPSCKAVAPNVESLLVTPFAGRIDYQVLGLDQWNGNQAAVQAFKTSTGVSFPILLNASGVAADYKTTYDRLVVIDQMGDIVFSGTQLASGDIAVVKQKVELLLAK